MTRHAVSRFVRSTLLYVLVVILALAFSLPLLWMISTSLKSNQEVFHLPPIWIPSQIRWDNYPRALNYIPYFRYLLNTLYICLATVIGSLISCTLAAYGFSRVQWPGRDTVFAIALSTMMVPYAVTMIPLFMVFKRLGWIGTYLPLTVPAFFGSPFLIFLLRQFFLIIPTDLSDAARIDGASELQILIHVVLPLARPALGMVALFQFMWAWGDYLKPLIYLRRSEQFTVALGLTQFLGEYRTEWALLMAATVVTVSPVIILFFVTQRSFIEGITLTGLKG